jgi:hypothetical protein
VSNIDDEECGGGRMHCAGCGAGGCAGSLRADALAAYEVAGKVRLFCLEVHISNNKLDLTKYERVCLGPDWIYPCLPVIVVVSDRQVKDRKLRGGIEVVRIGTNYEDWGKILQIHKVS